MRHTGQRNGTTTVEFAITLPIVLILFFGAIEMSRGNMIRNAARNAAYNGARKAIIPGGTTDQAKQEAGRILSFHGVRSFQVATTPTTITEQTKEIQITISIPLAENSWVIPRYLVDSTLTQSCTLTREPSQSSF